MDSNDETEDENEVVYDVTNIEELDHFDIGEDAPVLELPSDQINVMEFMGPTVVKGRTRERGRNRKNSNRIVHLASNRHDLKEDSIEPTEVVMEPGTSASRIFVVDKHTGEHMGLYLYSNNAEKYPTAAQIIVTIGDGLSPHKICHSVPQEFTATGTFVVEMSGLTNRLDIVLDGLGPWGNSQGSSRFYKLREDNQLAPGNPQDYTWKILCNRYTHPGTEPRGMFYKKIFTGVHSNGTPSILAVIVYEWTGEPHAISLDPSTIPHTGVLKEKAFGSRSWEGPLTDIFRDECLSYRELPVFSRIAVDFGTACRILFAHADLQDERICSQVPREFRECGTFVLDIARCGGERVLIRDGREWNKPSGSSRFFRTDEQGNSIRADLNNSHPGDHYDVQVMLKRYETLNPVGLIRKVYVAKDKAKRLISPIAVITYMYRAPGVMKTTICRPVAPVTKKRPYSAESNHHQAVEINEEDEMYELRRKTLEIQADNQSRFSELLDRAESFLDRFEQSGSQILVPLTRQLVQVWKGHDSRRPRPAETTERNQSPPFLEPLE